MVPRLLLILLLLFPAHLFAYPQLGSYAIEILLPEDDETVRYVDFSYTVECVEGQPLLTIRVFDEDRPAREVDARVALRPTGSSYYTYSEVTDNGVVSFTVEPGLYDISINPERPSYRTLREDAAISVDECPTLENVSMNETNATVEEEPEEEVEEPSPTAPEGGVSVSYCSAVADELFHLVGDSVTFHLEEDHSPYSGTAILESPDGRKIVTVEGGSYTFTAEREGYYSMDIPDCVMVVKDYVLASKPAKEEKRYEVKGLRAYSGCVLTFYSEEPYYGTLAGEDVTLHIPKTIGQYRILLRDGVYDLSLVGEVQVSMQCPEKRIFFERDLTMLLAALAVLMAILYLVYLFTAIEVVVEEREGGKVVRVYRKLSKEPVEGLRVSIARGEEIVYEDVTNKEGEVALPHLPPGTYRVLVGSRVRASFEV